MSYPEFPDFQPLGVEDKESYEQLTASYPQYSDIFFNTLLIWWNPNNDLVFSTIKDNLVLHYELPGDERNSGYSLIGDNEIDSSMSKLLDYLDTSDGESRLVHVPEFTIQSLHETEQLRVEEELDYAEYIIDSKLLTTLEGSEIGRIRRKVGRFLREIGERELTLTEVTFDGEDDKQKLFDLIRSWDAANATNNDPVDNGTAVAVRKTVALAETLGISNLGLYVDGVLYGIAFFSATQDSKYLVVHHLKANYEIPFIFDYMTHVLAKHAMDANIPYVNMEMDLGIESLREHKMVLKPVDFLRKYVVSRQEIMPNQSPATTIN